ncbi:MAG: putative beta-barrel porin 2 [Acidobacteria bacterium]|nr:putative beta-barrel porin 2 [Acidobacteriota bacterium]
MTSRLRDLLTVAALVLTAGVALAQEAPPDPVGTAPVHFGPLGLRPELLLTNLGIDTNVFNETDEEGPESDWTLTFGPAADFWLRLGRARLSGRAAVTYDWFAKFETQRAWGTNDRFRLELPSGHVRPYLGGSYLTARDRPGYEIDERVRHSERALTFGVDFAVSRKTTFGAGAIRTIVKYDETANFDDQWLNEVLNRTETGINASARYRVTPLTTLGVEAQWARERFEFSPERDGNSLRVVPGLEFDAFALVNGTAKVGYRKLAMLSPGMPDYSGPVASVDLGYTLLGVTRFAVGLSRDIEYSYSTTEPYYVLTGTTFSVTQAVGGPWALTFRTGLQRMAYRTLVAPGPALGPSGPAAAPRAEAGEGRTDHLRFYGGGVSYKIGPDVRMGVDANYYARTSEVAWREYSGLRIGGSVTYGF